MESQRNFKHGFRALALATLAFTAMLHGNPATAQVIHPHDNLQTAQKPNFAYEWMDVLLETTARDMERTGARPTVGSRQMAIVATAMFDAWAAYDERAVGTVYGNALRRPAAERTEANRRAAISYAVYRTTADQFPVQIEYLNQRMRAFGYDPDDRSLDITTAVGIGNTVAAGLMIASIGVSRVWLGVHWPSDVTAGWIEGLGWLALCRVWLPARGGQG